MYQYVHFHTAKPINLDAKTNMDVDTDPDNVVGVKTQMLISEIRQYFFVEKL